MTEETFSPRVLWDREGEVGVAETVLHWWARLLGQEEVAPQPFPSGTRAVLRRAYTPDDALLSEGFRHLWFALPPGRRQERDMLAWATVALALAEVRTHIPDQTFAGAMAQEKKKGEGPRVSELRFQQLLRSADLNELTRRVRRAVHLIGEGVDVRSLADDILLWNREKGGAYSLRPDHRLAVRWAGAYYTRLERNPQPASAG